MLIIHPGRSRAPSAQPHALTTSHFTCNTHTHENSYCAPQSVLGKDTVRSFAEALGHVEVEDDVCTLLASDLEYRLREITQVRAHEMHCSLSTRHLAALRNPCRLAMRSMAMCSMASCTLDQRVPQDACHVGTHNYTEQRQRLILHVRCQVFAGVQ